MQHPRSFLAYVGLGVSCAAFIAAGLSQMHETPIVAALLFAQALSIGCAGWFIRDARRSGQEVIALRAEMAGLKAELSHLDEHTELLAARTERMARALEVKKAVQPPGAGRETTGEVLVFPAGPRRLS
ncbi:hypothetical protein AMIS_2220 [Actinoplanes missouriensis 431]|uniref:Uncharacterized protein n=2 Tax=Actinoplanes missouriensis TaxID=1866 RepID=I0GXF5_ACTM4|nr:hypothetical protein ADL19_23255 [Streptomyces purpurogeneiscleroticus]BAL85442.1 hypothetical protein AMIS_2220 [Actinoplanes missouriensis 431]